MIVKVKPAGLRRGDKVLIDGRYRRIGSPVRMRKGIYVAASQGNGRRVWSRVFGPNEKARVSASAPEYGCGNCHREAMEGGAYCCDQCAVTPGLHSELCPKVPR